MAVKFRVTLGSYMRKVVLASSAKAAKSAFLAGKIQRYNVKVKRVKRHAKKALIALSAVVFSMSLSTPAKAQWTVYDPASFSRQVMNYLQDHKTLLATLQNLQKAVHQEQMMMQAYQTIHYMPRYGALFSNWRNLQMALDEYGNAAPFINAANSGNGVQGAYGRITTDMNRYPSGWISTLSPSGLGRLTAQAGTVGIRDSSNVSAMQTIGQIRYNSANVERAIAALKSDTMAGDQLNGSLVPVLQKSSAASLLQVQSQQDSNKLLTLLLEKEVMDSKTARDQTANGMTTDIALKTSTVQVTRGSVEGVGSALDGFQLR